jgi:dCTP deaminase
MVLSDTEIIHGNFISPLLHKQHAGGCISYGVSSYGYDIRCANEFKVLNKKRKIIDPKNITEDLFTDIVVEEYYIPQNSFVLARSYEWVKIPRDVLGICMGKSTYARCGIIINTTPLEPEWEGFITLEISNTTPLPVKIYANEGIAQLFFIKASQVCKTSYADKKGKYQHQQTVEVARV